MKFAKYTFLIAGVYGILVLLPQYFFETKTGVDTPPAITHPEFFYGFVGLGLAFQLVFLVISTDPAKYRLFILPSIVEKFSFAIAAAVLYFNGRLAGPIIYGAAIDVILGLLFIASWFKLERSEARI